MYEGGDGKNRETFPHIPDEPSKPQNFSPLKLLLFTVLSVWVIAHFVYSISKANDVAIDATRIRS